MSPSPDSSQSPNFLGKFASVIGLLGSALFFVGWIYRWSYFYFFQLEITTLDLSAQSFFFVPLQVFFLAPQRGIIFLVTVIPGLFVLWLLQLSIKKILSNITWLSHLIKFLSEFSSTQLESIRFLWSLVEETVIVALVLVVLFWVSQFQGTADARRDAGPSSTLPVVALVTPETRIALGRKLDDVFIDPSLKGYKIIGDKGLFNDLRGREDNDTLDPEYPRVWRLLIERAGWIYLFPSLPPNADPNDRPPVLAIQESQLGEQLMILSPEPSKPRKK